MLDQITIFGIISLINFLTCVFIGTFLLYKNTKNPINVSYCVFDFCVAFYAFFYFLWQSSSNSSWGILFFKWCIFGVVLINSAFVHFTYVVLSLHQRHKNQLLFVHAVNAFFCYGSLALFYDTWKIKYSYGLWPIPSTIFHFYITWWFLQVIYCFCLLHRRGIAQSTGKQRRQYQWIFWATLIAYAGGATNWFVWYDIGFPPYLNAGIAIYTVVLAYAIFRHQLLDIPVLIKKTLVFAGLFGMVMAVVGAVSTLMQGLVGRALAVSPLVSTAGSVILAILLYDPTRKLLVHLTDRFLFQKQYDFDNTLKTVSGEVGRLASSTEILGRLVDTLLNTVRVEDLSFYLFDRRLNVYCLRSARGSGQGPLPIQMSPDDPLIGYLKMKKEPLVRDTLEPGQRNLNDQLKKIGSQVAVPSFVKDELAAVWLLGPKRSDQDYSEQDLALITALSNQVALALDNAFYTEELFKRRHLDHLAKLVRGFAHEVINAVFPLQRTGEGMKTGVYLKLFDIYKALEQSGNSLAGELKVSIVELRETIQALETYTQHAILVVNTLHKMQRGDEAVGPFHLPSFLDEALELAAFETDTGTVGTAKVELNVEHNLPPVRGNPTLLYQVLFNLYKNALDAMNGVVNPTLHIRARVDPESGQYVRIDFEDSGPGISPELLPRLFTHGVTTKGSKGSGIGLYQCKTIVEGFGGELNVKSEPGKGAAFAIRLPIDEKGT